MFAKHLTAKIARLIENTKRQRQVLLGLCSVSAQRVPFQRVQV